MPTIYNKSDYTISFLDAMDRLTKGEWLQGDDFVSGFYLKLTKDGFLVLVDANSYFKEEPFNNIMAMTRQKFKRITVGHLAIFKQ